MLKKGAIQPIYTVPVMLSVSEDLTRYANDIARYFVTTQPLNTASVMLSEAKYLATSFAFIARYFATLSMTVYG